MQASPSWPCLAVRASCRAASAAQGAPHFRDIRYTAGLTYGEMLLQSEYEMSCYNLDRADVAAQRQLFALFQQARPRSVLRAVCACSGLPRHLVALAGCMFLSFCVCGDIWGPPGICRVGAACISCKRALRTG